MESNTVNSINMTMFGDVVNTSESSILENISNLRGQISQLLEQLEDLPTMRRRALTQENIKSLREKWPSMLINTDQGSVTIDLRDHHVNFLYGSLQERENIKNTAIIYQTLPRYTTRIKVYANRHVDVSNQTGNQFRELLSIQRRIANTATAQTIPPEMGTRPFNSPGDGFSVCHPHAQGNKSGFTSLCYGNNRWAEALRNATNGTDVLSVFDRAMLWASSANMLDMYGNYLSEGFHPPTAEGQLPSTYREVLNDVMRFLLSKVQKPVLDYVLTSGRYGHGLVMDSNFAELCGNLLDEIPGMDEFNTVFSTDRFLALHTAPIGDGTSVHPLIWSLIALRGFLAREDNQSLFSYPNYGASISVILMALKKAYAMWLLVHSRYIHNCKNCLLSALRTDAYSMAKYSTLTDITILQALQAPLGMYSVVGHVGAQQSTFDALAVCNFA